MSTVLLRTPEFGPAVAARSCCSVVMDTGRASVLQEQSLPRITLPDDGFIARCQPRRVWDITRYLQHQDSPDPPRIVAIIIICVYTPQSDQCPELSSES